MQHNTNGSRAASQSNNCARTEERHFARKHGVFRFKVTEAPDILSIKRPQNAGLLAVARGASLAKLDG